MFEEDEIEMLETILINCQQLESIEVWCGDIYLNEMKLLEVVAKCSPKTFYELKIFYVDNEEFFAEDLEPVFISLANRIPRKPLSLIIIDYSTNLKVKKESINVIEKFKKLGVIKKFEIVYD